MKFKQAYREMSKGKKVKRPGWGGYWFIEDGKVKIKSKTSEILENNFNEEAITNIFANDWKVIEEKKWWIPKDGQLFYFANSTLSIIGKYYNENDTIDKRRISISNCFQNIEQAEFMAEKLRVIHELEKFAFENNEKEIDWNDVNQTKYYLVMFKSDKIIAIFFTYKWCYTPFNIYFTSEEIAEKAIATIGEDRIKKYYFGVNEE